jgi:hypothetical protein
VRLRDAAPEAGLTFHHYLGATGRYYFPEIMGSGCALLDYDNDGDLDAYLVQGALLGPDRTFAQSLFPPQVPLPPRNRLFRNESTSAGRPAGALRFTDVTDASGAGDTGYGMGAATGDYDNDGDVDLYVTNFGPDVLLRNDGDGTFTDVTAAAGLGDPRWTASATFFDYDADGFLDLFVVAYADYTIAAHHDCYLESGSLDYCGPTSYPAVPARLYRNLGTGSFADVSAAAGIDVAYGHGLGVAAGGFDGAGRQDVYVANDSDRNLLWLNRGEMFTETGVLGGAAYGESGVPRAGMGIAVGDHDDDGDPDLFVTNLIGETNALFENDGRGFFEDATARRGLGWPSLPNTGFGVGWFDADHDADLDLFVVNGDVRTVEALRGRPYPYHQPNQLMVNNGRGRYEDLSAAAGPDVIVSEVSRGAAFGDVDNDGDVDILVSNNNGPARLLLNELEERRNWILLRILDRRLKRDALGAAVRVTLSDGRVLTRYVRTDGSYLSASDPRVHVAWPLGVEMLSLEIVPPGGRPIPVRDAPVPGASTVLLGPEGAEVAGR